jgi:ATP synthase protein I
VFQGASLATIGPNDGDNRPSPLFRALRVSSVGIEMAVATGIGWAIGYWLDRRLGTGPWLMLVFLLLGVAAGFKGLLRTARQMQRDGETGESSSPGPESK